MKFIIALAISSVFYTAHAAEDSFDFKGIALNSNISEIQQNPKFNCNETKSALADQICRLKFREKETIADVPIELLTLFFYEGILNSINITFNSNNFNEVQGALVAKYGDGEPKHETVRNGVGTSFENRIYTWKKNGQTLQAKRYSGKITRSSVTFELDSSIEKYTAKKKLLGIEKANDL